MQVVRYRDLANLPHFNPDLDGDEPPAIIQSLRNQVMISQGILISSPEYARGVAGALKNALDWLVSSLEFPGKPVALINASPRASDADAQLRLILTTMSASLVQEACVTLPLLGRGLDAEGIVADPELSGPLSAARAKFFDYIVAST